MGKRRKIHFSEHRDGPLWETACGRFEVTATQQIELVTCKKCRQRLNKSPVELIAEVIAPVFQDIEPLSDPESGLPILTRDTYLRRDCKCGSCQVCRHFKAIQADHELEPWKDRPTLHEQARFRWRTARQAVEWYLGTIELGYRERSSYEAMVRPGRVGARIETSADLEALSIRDADDRVTVERALKQANTEPGSLVALFRILQGEPANRDLFRRTLRRVGTALANMGAIPHSPARRGGEVPEREPVLEAL